MRIAIQVVGRLKETYWREAEAEYLKRLQRYASLQVREARDDNGLVAQIPQDCRDCRLVVLDQRGELWSSEDLAHRLLAEEEQRGGGRTLVFVIGGRDGVPAAVRAKAHPLLAFGRITLAHRLARIVLLEQIYRAFTILRHEPYHS
ncbi:MAG: 23S rRNA (pseudouridine(1915)-N(3))-methyltransferase RlmH [Pseudomonadota bacterium]